MFCPGVPGSWLESLGVNPDGRAGRGLVCLDFVGCDGDQVENLLGKKAKLKHSSQASMNLC